MSGSAQSAHERMKLVIKGATRGLVERRLLVELVVLAAVAREHLLVIGPPGTAKSQAVRAISKQLGGSYFEYLVGRFTEPTDIFGAIDLAKLREGQVEVQTKGMLPEAEIAFLDEVFLGSNAILNTLLALLNERTFVRGHTRKKSPLRVCVGASNSLPEEPALEAFADRFLLRAFVSPLPDEMLETLLEAGWGEPVVSDASASVADLDALTKQAREVDMGSARSALAESIRALRDAGVHFGDRRIVKTQRLVAAATVLRGSSVASEADLWPLIYCAPTQESQTIAREVLKPKLEASENVALIAAAEDASLAPAARAERLSQEAEELLAEHQGRPPRAFAEAILREITASLATEVRSERLNGLVEQLSSSLDSGASSES